MKMGLKGEYQYPARVSVFSLCFIAIKHSHSSLFADSRVVNLPDCFIEISCVTDCIVVKAYSEGCRHSENFMGCTVAVCSQLMS